MSKRTFVLLLLIAAGGGAWFFRGRSSASIVNDPPRDGPILAFGDSLTEGHGAPEGSSYPDQLSRILGRPVINAGVSGNTVEEALARFDRDVLAEKPSVVIVCLGGNNLLQRGDPDATFKSLEIVVRRCQEGGALVVLVGVEGLPLISGGYGPRYARLARSLGCVYVADILGGIMGNDKLMSDQIHPNAEGYGIFAKRVADALLPYLKKS